ncbi:MAG TPA: hypothetical protein ENN31_00720 [Candidatus Vogelbacteria bacterium]|nr:hypothetical protein [Candidatus Vogelbacteria bacterium]
MYYSILELFLPALKYLVYFMPLIFFALLWRMWINYVQLKFQESLEWILLEIKIPRNITKSPLAMEMFLSSLQQTRDGTFIQRWWEGLLRSWFSLEIVSIGGNVRFFIYTQKFFKNLVEAEIYAQYPEVEIFEVEDYTKDVVYKGPGSDLDIWGCHFALTKKDAYPIKTYVDYKLDQETKDEYKNDPITPILEFMGSIKPEEQIWFQIIFMAAKKRFKKKGSWFKKVDWRDDGQELVKKLLKRDKKPAEGGFPQEFTLSAGEKKVVEAVERNISKIGFDCGIRGIYIAPKDNFNFINVVGIISMLKQFNSLDLNGFKPANTTGFEYPWKDPWGFRTARLKKRMFKSYRARGYFHYPFIYKPMTLNTEELATIYHFPGQVAETPSLSRIGSRRAEPPSNLPI